MYNFWDEWDEFDEIGLGLERYHGIFYQLWTIGRPRFTKEIPTAAVSFNKEGNYIEFLFNREFWDSLKTVEEKEFIICHEMLHVLMNHGKRGKEIEPMFQEVANWAMDITINESLVRNFGFDRHVSEVLEGLVWFDKVFGKDTPFEKIKIQEEREFEYYFNILREQIEKEITAENIKVVTIGVPADGQGSQGNTADNMMGFGQIDKHQFNKGNDKNNPNQGGIGDIPEKILDEIAGAAKQRISENENKDLANKIGGLMKGDTPGDAIYKASLKAVKLINKWEKVVKIWTGRGGEWEDENWTKRSRRHFCLPNDLILPAFDENDSKGKINLWFFQDTSGSCVSYKDYFFNSAKTFPKHSFNIKLFGFDTRVYPIVNEKLQGFGGTSFIAVDEFIRKELKEKKLQHPDAIFIFTDGYGDNVQPEHPERWYWFMIDAYGNDQLYTACIPKQSHTFKLRDFTQERVVD